MTQLLIVEDDPQMIKGLKMFFSSQGYEVTEAMDGESGVKCALEGDPDDMMLDVMLPKMNGFDVCKKIRKQKTGETIILLNDRGE